MKNTTRQALEQIAANCELTARTFPNAPGRGDTLENSRIALIALAQSEITEEEEIRRGEEIARILGLKRNSAGRFDTTHGDKTALGLFRTLEWFVIDGG